MRLSVLLCCLLICVITLQSSNISNVSNISNISTTHAFTDFSTTGAFMTTDQIIITCNESCAISCDASSTCFNAIIYCPTNPHSSCTIECKKSNSCQYAVIHAESTWELDIDCQKSQACSALTVYGPDESIIDINTSINILSQAISAAKNMIIYANYTDFVTVRCFYGSSCRESTFYMQNTSIFTAEAFNANSMKDSVFYATYMTQMTMQCSSETSCRNITIYGEYMQNMYLDCDNGACMEMDIDVSHAGDINIICDSCNYANIYGIDTDLIDFECRDYESCNNTEISVLTNASLLVYCHTSNSCAGLKIYQRNGYNPAKLEFDCKQNSFCNDIQLFCDQNVNHSCTVKYYSSFSDAVCVSDNDDFICGETLYPTLYPTIPTMEPSLLPTIATLSPTVNPTVIDSGTHYPTLHPGSNDNQNQSNDGNTWKKYEILFVGIIVCFATFCCIVSAYLFYQKMYKKNEIVLCNHQFERNQENDVDQAQRPPQRDGMPNGGYMEMTGNTNKKENKNLKVEGTNETLKDDDDAGDDDNPENANFTESTPPVPYTKNENSDEM